MPGLRRLQQDHDFGLAQFTVSSCLPLLGLDAPGVPLCRGLNDEIFARIKNIRPDIVLMLGVWSASNEEIADLPKTVALVRKLGVPRVIVIGSVPIWPRGLPNEIAGYFIQHNSIPQRLGGSHVSTNWYDALLLKELAPAGGEFISGWAPMCNSDGCLVYLGDNRANITATDQVHFTESASEFFAEAISDKLLKGYP
jgi:hypothetical protein